MALKDWKKIYDVKYLIRFKNKNTYDKVGVVEVTTDKWAVKDKDITWKVQYYKNYGTVNLLKSNFKTKSQALKFAKSYMRTH